MEKEKYNYIEIEALEQASFKFLKNSINIKEIVELKNYVMSLEAEDRQSYIQRLCIIFINYIKNFNYEGTEDKNELNENIIEIVDMLKVVSISDMNAEKALVDFIADLKDNRGFGKNINKRFIEEYGIFQDIIQDINWIFKLKNNGILIFPMHELISKVILNFKCDNDHLLQVAVALGMYSAIQNFAKLDLEDTIKNEIIKITDEHNMEILKCLTFGGKLMFQNRNNYLMNNVLVVRDSDKIIVRNLYKEYFSNWTTSKIEVEKNGDEEIAYYVCIPIERDYKFCSFAEIMKTNNSQYKIDMLNAMRENNNYNVLLSESFILNEVTGKFIGITNPFGKSDNSIVYENYCVDNSFLEFLKILKEKVKNIRDTYILSNGINVLTLDFIINFYLMVVKDRRNLYLNFNSKDDDFYQNILIKNFFDDILKSKKEHEINKIIGDYYLFAKQYQDYTIRENEIMDYKMGLVMPYKVVVPYGNTIIEYLEYYKKCIWENEDININPIMVTYTKRYFEDIYFVEGTDLSEWSILDFNQEEVTIDKLPKSSFYAYTNMEEKKVYFTDELRRSVDKVEWIYNISNQKSVNCYDNIDLYDKDLIKKVIEIINNIGINYINYRVFNLNDNNNDNSIIPLFKLLWHFQIYGIDSEKIKIFFNVVIHGHYTESVLNSEAISKYFEELVSESAKDGVLIIAKEAFGDSGTLQYMYEKWGKRSGEKNILSRSFDARELEQNINLDSKFNYRGNVIKKIIFMTDNIMGGGATKQMLEFHINNIKKDKNKRFVELCSDKNVNQIITINDNVEIVVYSIFGYENGEEKIREEYSVEVISYNKIDSQYICDANMKRNIKLLYNYDVKEGIHCMLRYNNMPNSYVFPNNVVDTKNLVGIFNRKKELPK